jgi:hypothetical protein
MPDQVIRVDGTVYSAVPELSSVEELDALARFFLEEVLPNVRRIGDLLDIFGLPKRLVEDILADLLKQNRISLRLDTGEVEVLNRPPLRRRRRAGTPIEIWQDDSTGALLPFRMIAVLSRPSSGEEIAHLSADGTESVGLLGMADSQILARLASLDPGMRVSAEGWVPESLREKVRVKSLPIYIPVATADVNGVQVKFAHAPQLPYWLTKAWSLDLVQAPDASPQIVEEASTGARLEDVGSPEGVAIDSVPGALEAADMGLLLKRWANSISDLLESGTDTRTLLNRHHHAEVRLDSVEANLAFRGAVQLVEQPAWTHLTEMWEQTTQTLVLVSNDWSAELLQRVAASTVGHKDRDAHLIMVDCSDGKKSRPLPPVKEVFFKSGGGGVELISIPPANLNFCVSDGRIARLGGLKAVLLTKNPAITASGMGAIEALLAPVTRRLDAKGGGRWLLSQLQKNNDPDDERMEGRETSDEIRRLTYEMKALNTDLRIRIDSLIEEAKLARDREMAEAQESEVRRRVLRDLDPDFAARLDLILDAWHKVDVMLPQLVDSAQETLGQFCGWASRPDRQHEMEVYVSGIPAGTTRAVGAGLRRVLKSGTRITLNLTHPAGRKAVGRLGDLFGDSVDHPLFSVHFLPVQMPNALVADSRLIALSSGNWLRDGEQDHYGFMFHSQAFARVLQEFARRRRTAVSESSSSAASEE